LELTLALVAGACMAHGGQKALIVADEFPAMEVLAAKLRAGAGTESTIVQQTQIPAGTAQYGAMIVYIHKTIGEPAEKAFIAYAEAGGKLILLHHSISSGKRPNKYWFPFLGVSLPTGDVAQGGYKYYDPVTMELVNLAPKHYITTHKVAWDGTTAYSSSGSGGGEKQCQSIVLPDTEVYLNHVFDGDRTILLGVKCKEPKSGITYMQDRGGWYRPAGKGWVMYFMAGHSGKDFEHSGYAQILVNAVAGKLK
jgi:hypothetical protein